MKPKTISVNPDVLGGKPVIQGTRIPVYVILELMEAGKSMADIVADYPELTKQDVKNALHYAHALLKREELVLNP